MRTAKTMTRLGGRPGRSESFLGRWFCHAAAQFCVVVLPTHCYFLDTHPHYFETGFSIPVPSGVYSVFGTAVNYVTVGTSIQILVSKCYHFQIFKIKL